jgi:hypothetical protein
VLVALDGDEDVYPSVFRLDVVTGQLTEVVRQRKPIMRWIADRDGVVRFGYGFEGKKGQYLARDSADSEWRTLLKFDRFDPDLKDGGDFGIRQPFQMPQDDGKPLSFGKPGQRALQRVCPRLFGQPLFRPHALIGHIRGGVQRIEPRPAQAVQAQVCRHPIQPARHARRTRLPAGCGPEQTDQGLLRHILGLGAVAQHPDGQPKGQPGKPVCHRPWRTRIAGRIGGQQSVIAIGGPLPILVNRHGQEP